MKILINYADSSFKQAQKICTKKGYKKGKFDKVIEYGPDCIDEGFKKKNSAYFVEGVKKIGRYGLWRPYILLQTYKNAQEGDYIVYCDSGAYFIKNVDILIDFMEKEKQSILCFDIPFLEYQWTKRDVFIYLNCDCEKIAFTNQRCSTYFVIKKVPSTEKFVYEYFSIARYFPELFTDSDNVLGKENYKGFVENRHNQSVFSVLTKKYGFKSYRDPSEFGNRPELYSFTPHVDYNPVEHTESTYPQMILLHRCRKITLKNILNVWVRLHVSANLYYKILFNGQKLKSFLKKRE